MMIFLINNDNLFPCIHVSTIGILFNFSQQPDECQIKHFCPQKKKGQTVYSAFWSWVEKITGSSL